jgi:hypothetical protein
MAEDGSAAAKSFEKVASILEKLVDNRMLVLWAAFIQYFDIWLIASNTDMTAITVDSALLHIKAIDMRTVVDFVAIFSVLMCLVFPSIRYTYCILLAHYGSFRYVSRERTPDQQKMSNWAAATIGFGIWDLCSGALRPAGEYHGYFLYVTSQLEKSGLVSTIFAVSFMFFVLFCLGAAFDKDY